MKWQKIELEADNKLDLYDYLIRIYCAVHKIYLPNSERILLTYYAAYGVNKDTEEMYMDEYHRSRQMVSNLKFSLKTFGVLHKEEDMSVWKLPPFLKQRIEDVLSLTLEISVK